ncbi:hypothetical protein [Streptomyces sp. M2CJ-2]|uniref:transposase n=1 Tax=Streptomyces sp. M2CJ-2 TaxID=2803948 RepID=UPI0034D669F1
MPRADAATALQAGGVLVVDDSEGRKDGTTTAHVGRQWLGRYGKTDNAVVTVTTLWAGERLCCPLHVLPCTPVHHFAGGRSDPAFRTKWRITTRPAGLGPPDSPSAPRWPTAPTATRPAPRWTPPASRPGVVRRSPARGRPVVLPRRTQRHRVGHRRHARFLGTGRDPPAGGGRHRSGHPAGEGHLVPGHRSAPARRPARRRVPLSARRVRTRVVVATGSHPQSA